MTKKVVILTMLFMLNAFSSLMAIPLAGLSLIAGVLICGNAILKRKTQNEEVLKSQISAINNRLINNFLFQSGLVLTITPIITVALVIAGMSGLFTKL
jgi:hypothetical protein